MTANIDLLSYPALCREDKGDKMKLKGVVILAVIGLMVMSSFIASAGKSNTLTTDKSAYNVGEVVIITFTNNGDEAVIIPDGYVILDETGKEVYSPNCLMYVPPLAPGESMVYTWDMTRNDGKTTEPGDYTVYTSWDTAEFKVIEPASETLHKSPEKNSKKIIDFPEPVIPKKFA